ncbi:MAG: transposase [Promethearchaeota archaeon]
MNYNYKYKEFLRYTCIFCTKGYISLFTSQDLKEKTREIIDLYFKQNADVELISVDINLRHLGITFKTRSSEMDLPKFISNLKSVSSRKILQYLKSINNKISGIWSKNYLLATEEHLLEQKINAFLETQ